MEKKVVKTAVRYRGKDFETVVLCASNLQDPPICDVFLCHSFGHGLSMSRNESPDMLAP